MGCHTIFDLLFLKRRFNLIQAGRVEYHLLCSKVSLSVCSLHMLNNSVYDRNSTPLFGESTNSLKIKGDNFFSSVFLTGQAIKLVKYCFALISF